MKGHYVGGVIHNYVTIRAVKHNLFIFLDVGTKYYEYMLKEILSVYGMYHILTRIFKICENEKMFIRYEM